MLYEMIGVARVSKHSEVKELVLRAGRLILAHGGVIRGITNWGPFLLIKPKRHLAGVHESGRHFIIRFDSSPEVQEAVRKNLAVDPRMLRCGLVKMSGKLKDIAHIKGKVPWKRNMAESKNHGGAVEQLQAFSGLGQRF